MLIRARKNPSFCRPPVLLLSILNNRIRIATRMGDLPTAVDTLKVMRELRVQPNVMTFNMILLYLSQAAGDTDSVLLLYKAMKSDKVKPDARTYAIAVQSLIKAGLNDDAWLLFTEMNALPEIPDHLAISTLISADKSNAPAEILTKLFNVFKERYKQDTPDVLYSSYIFALFKRNLYEAALEEYNSLKMMNRKGNDSTTNFIINIASRRGDFDLIMKCLADLTPTNVSFFTFSPILRSIRLGSLVLPDLKALSELRGALQRLNAAAHPEGQALLTELDSATTQAKSKQ
eukprot:TRINITY_DN3358_c0_g5_i2.p1 TRINITY_DN3358_c0_g5~~TRINITY_DN3358_c0_g5_i2.p1  ORF type:complete len:289 (+),score=43.96 TRINITY_DN3358_c0_g5_i2:225-1091(+)